MKNLLTLLIFILTIKFSWAQVVINELDSDTQGIDDKEFVELKTDQPFVSLDDYVLVFFNGSPAGGNKSYFTIDLYGYSSDINGIFLIGSSNVSPFPDLLIPPNVIQNGADAVGVYHGEAIDFPDWTLATTDNLIDALVYGTSDPVSHDLLELLGQTKQIDEDKNHDKDFESIQRNQDGTYFVGVPTPGQNNDGSGVLLNGIAVSIPQEQYEEGDNIPIYFTTTNPVEEDLNFDFTLDNYGFNENDFTGNTSVHFDEGDSTASVNLHILNDGINDGDEILRFEFGTLPDIYRRLNDYLEVRIVDANFMTSAFGTPLNPTYNIVESTQPPTYYNSLDGLSGEQLRQAIQDIIADPDVVRVQTYADVIDMLKEADQNPANNNQVWLIYTEQGRAKLDYQYASSSSGKWNREHTFPRSRGGFYARPGDEIADGKNVYWTTSADSTRQGFSDAHALRAVDGPENSSRNNQNYGPQEYDGPDGTAGSFYGDVARSILYMTVRYNGLEAVNGYPSSHNLGQIGDLQTLIDWNQQDPPDDFEMNRNNIIYTWQYNRNPFIDYPDLIDYIWGDQVGEVWHQPDMSVINQNNSRINIYPNPAQNQLSIDGLTKKSNVQIISLTGQVLMEKSINIDHFQWDINKLDPGIYFITISTKNQQMTKRLILR